MTRLEPDLFRSAWLLNQHYFVGDAASCEHIQVLTALTSPAEAFAAGCCRLSHCKYRRLADGSNKISAVWVRHTFPQRSSLVLDNLDLFRKLLHSWCDSQNAEKTISVPFRFHVAAHFLLTFFFWRDSVCLGAVSSVSESEFYEDAKGM